MDVELYIYDLSQGLARQASLAFLGTQIDAIYHTSIVFGGIEYTYDGGIKTVQPGKTHLGPPIQTLDLGTTMLPMDVIMEYMDSLKEIYTQEAYDIWKHNCNNFSNDLATFLVGKGIPDYILKLPDTVLSTGFGQRIQPLINTHVMDQKRKAGGGLLGIDRTNSAKKPLSNEERAASVMMPTTLRELDDLLAKSKDSCTVIFFTSPTCKPCKTLYPHYVDLAAEHKHDCTFILVNTINAFEIANKYSISATPTFMTFLHGEEENRWSGADLNTLKNNTNSLINMAWPTHLHESLKLHTLRESNIEPVLYGKLPPMEKLKIKMGKWAEEPSVVGVMAFVSARKDEGAAEATLPDLDGFSWFLRAAPSKLPPEILFTIVDLLRLGLMDPRFSGYFAQEKDHKTIAPLLAHINGLRDCPYALRLVALQTGCNLFSSSLYPDHILMCQVLTEPLVQLIATSLLDDKHNITRVAAASLAFNMAVANGRARREQHKEALPEDQQTELAACLLEAIMVEEESPEALKGYLLAFAHLVLCCPKGGEMVDLLKSMGAQDTILQKKKQFPDEPLVQEIGKELLGKGF